MIIWRLRRAARNLDWSALAGALLAVFAAGLYLSAVRPLEARTQGLRERVIESESRAGAPDGNAEPAGPALQLAAFYEQLADVHQAPEVVRQLHAHAEKAGLALERGEYRPLTDASAKLVRYQIVLPVKGGYPQVRRFLAGAMQDIPGLALDGISFQRDNDASAQLEAQLRFTIFLRMSS